MKKLIVLLLVLLSIASAKIMVQGVDLSQIDEHYIWLDINYGFKSKCYFAYVNYGQEAKFRDKVALNENGYKWEFNSTVDVLNTFYKNGWELKTAITRPSGGGDDSSVSSYTYYILERKDEK